MDDVEVESKDIVVEVFEVGFGSGLLCGVIEHDEK